MSSFKIKIDGVNNDDLERKVSRELGLRLQSADRSYTEEEIKRISTMTQKLIGNGVKLPLEILESIRAAATLANSDLKPHPDFSSHRPMIGWLIVLVKKLSWPLVRFHLHRHFDNQSELNRRLLYTQVKLFEEAAQRKGN